MDRELGDTGLHMSLQMAVMLTRANINPCVIAMLKDLQTTLQKKQEKLMPTTITC